MRFVLENETGFYAGEGENRYGGRESKTTTDLSQAIIYAAAVVNGKLVTDCAMPDGAWLVKAIALSVHRG